MGSVRLMKKEAIHAREMHGLEGSFELASETRGGESTFLARMGFGSHSEGVTGLICE